MRRPKAERDPTFPYFLPTERVAVIMERAAEQAGFAPGERNNGSRDWLAHRTGLGGRRVYGILGREAPTVTFDTVDKILIGLDLLDLWHIPAEEGGLADFYEATLENPAPPLPEHTPEQRAFANFHNKRRLDAKRKRDAELEKARKAWVREQMAVA